MHASIGGSARIKSARAALSASRFFRECFGNLTPNSCLLNFRLCMAINFSLVSKMKPHISENTAQNNTAARGLKCSPMKPTARLPIGAVPMKDSV